MTRERRDPRPPRAAPCLDSPPTENANSSGQRYASAPFQGDKSQVEVDVTGRTSGPAPWRVSQLSAYRQDCSPQKGAKQTTGDVVVLGESEQRSSEGAVATNVAATGPKPALLTVEQAASRLSVSVRMVKQLLSAPPMSLECLEREPLPRVVTSDILSPVSHRPYSDLSAAPADTPPDDLSAAGNQVLGRY